MRSAPARRAASAGMVSIGSNSVPVLFRSPWDRVMVVVRRAWTRRRAQYLMDTEFVTSSVVIFSKDKERYTCKGKRGKLVMRNLQQTYRPAARLSSCKHKQLMANMVYIDFFFLRTMYID
jgi:hypothetical protein